MKDPLIKRLNKHDHTAFEEIVHKYLPLVSTVVYNIGESKLTKEDMEEVISDVLVTLWKNTDKIIEGKLKGYLCSIARTKTLDKLYYIKEPPLDIDDLPLEDDFYVEGIAEANETAEILQQLISEIPEPDREILIRYYYYRQTAPQIAEKLRMKLPTVKSKLKRTREKLRRKLAERGYSV